eukprot:1179464-Prorocentrum_minimum.AAC.1
MKYYYMQVWDGLDRQRQADPLNEVLLSPGGSQRNLAACGGPLQISHLRTLLPPPLPGHVLTNHISPLAQSATSQPISSGPARPRSSSEEPIGHRATGHSLQVTHYRSLTHYCAEEAPRRSDECSRPRRMRIAHARYGKMYTHLVRDPGPFP